MRLLKRAGFLDQSKISKIIELLRKGGGGKVKFAPLSNAPSLDKIVIENSAPPDNPSALAWVQQGSNDIHLVLSKIESAIQSEMAKNGIDSNELSSLDLSNLEDNPKLNTIMIVLSAALQIFSHELGHLSGSKDSGELKSEQFAEEEARKAMDTMKVSSVKAELNKLASKLDDLGETEYVEDVFLISSMLKDEEESTLPKKVAQKDLDMLVKNLENSFKK